MYSNNLRFSQDNIKLKNKSGPKLLDKIAPKMYLIVSFKTKSYELNLEASEPK